MMKYFPFACMALFGAIIAAASYADFSDDVIRVFTDVKVLDGCQKYTVNTEGMWCIGAGGQGVYQWNAETHALDLLCAGGVNRLQWLEGVGIMAQGASDPDLQVWWTPSGNGQCKAVRVTVQ